ncbi:tail fiber/spike domain-containing protein [Enterobacter kobei]|uniref:tail fiber/spike domain-containing protein n=1 Tax=Enterobacter kobei TaxID=208224 RepID=UPI002004B80E|nr:hypothetical protein [Enterobacter kobei]MCK7006351.1 hypothetical protein [Enterobacter kobei]
MATQPTQDAVPSESPRDLKFNAGKIDEFVTSMGWTYTDRFGQKHYTIEGINYLAQQAMNAFGYVILTGKTFTTGATINNPNEVLLNTADGEYYKWTGSFASGPKVVPANSTPASTGGIAPGAWLGVGDASLRAALAAVSGAGLVGVSVGSVYPAGTVGSAIQYRTPQMYGIEPSTTNIIGAGLDAMFAAGGDIRFEKPGTYLTDRAWVLRSGTRLWIGPGVILKATDSYNGNILRNYSYAVNAGAGTADDFIEVWGPGTIDFNGLAKGFNGTNSMASVFKNVTTLRIGGGLLVRNARKYCWLIAKIQNLHVDGLRFNTISDGLHLQNPCQNVYIRNLSGVTGDDMCALTIGDYPYYDISEAGDFSNVDIAGIYSLNQANDEGTTTTTLLTFGGDGSGVYVRMKIAGLYGNTNHAVARFNADTNGLTYTKVNNLHVSEIYAVPNPANAYPIIEINDRGYGASPNLYGVEIDDLTIENVYTRNDVAPVVGISGTYGTMVHQLTINNGPRNGLGLVALNNANTTFCETLIINNCRTIFPVNANSSVVQNRGVLGQVFLNNIQASFTDTTQGRIYRGIGTNSLTKMHVNNLTQLRGLAAFYSTAAMATQPEIYISNATFDGSTGVVDLTGTTAKVYCRNVKAPVASGFVPFSSNAGTYYISGDVDTDGSNTLATSNAGIIRLMRGIHNIACDLTKLTSVDNSGCYNSNASLSCGVGMVNMQNKIWKHIYTAATYTSSI